MQLLISGIYKTQYCLIISTVFSLHHRHPVRFECHQQIFPRVLLLNYGRHSSLQVFIFFALIIFQFLILLSSLLFFSVCQQVKKGVAAIFGPISTVSAAHVQSICGSLQIPNLHTEWDSRDVNERSFFAINIYPHYQTMSRAYLDLIRYWGWRKFAVLYEDNDGKLQVFFFFILSFI